MAIRRTLAQFSDEIVAADIAANAVGASELADDAVDTAAIATNAVTATEIVAGAVTEAKLNADVTDGSAIATSVKPHIRTGVLQPAVAGKLLDGSTSHSGAYGTAQSDTFSYYYTDIKGSKPIKDPRIGSHFGSQRHKFKSLQLLEQETVTHGENVYSLDGREWCRASSSTIVVQNHNHGNDVNFSDVGGYVEFTGYFNDFNVTMFTYSNRNVDIDITVNGTLMIDGNITLAGDTTVTGNALMSRFVDPHSVINAGSITAN